MYYKLDLKVVCFDSIDSRINIYLVLQIFNGIRIFTSIFIILFKSFFHTTSHIASAYDLWILVESLSLHYHILLVDAMAYKRKTIGKYILIIIVIICNRQVRWFLDVLRGKNKNQLKSITFLLIFQIIKKKKKNLFINYCLLIFITISWLLSYEWINIVIWYM